MKDKSSSLRFAPQTRLPRLSPSQQFAVFSLGILLLLGGALAWSLSGQIEQLMAAAISETIGHQVSTMN